MAGGIIFEEKIGLSIFVTHANPVTIKSLGKLFRDRQKELQVMACFVNEKYTIINRKELIAQGIDVPELPLDFSEFIVLIGQIKSREDVSRDHVRVCCDANLGKDAGAFVTQSVQYLLESTHPEEVVLFTSTPSCLENAQMYLSGEVISDTIQLPADVRYGFAADRAQLSSMIKNNQHRNKIGLDDLLNDSTVLGLSKVSTATTLLITPEMSSSSINLDNSSPVPDALDHAITPRASHKEAGIGTYQSTTMQYLTWSTDHKISPTTLEKDITSSSSSSLDDEDEEVGFESRKKPGP